MAICNREIIGYITKEENYKRLEDFLKKETKEFYKLPWRARWLDFEKKVRKKEHAEKILARAKEDVDNFLGPEHAVALPELELISQLTVKDYQFNSNANILNVLLVGAGLLILYQGNKTGDGNTALVGEIIAGVGMASGIIQFGRKVRQNSPMYLPCEHKITCVKRKEPDVYCDMMHEYSHAVFMRAEGDRKECEFANEGFAEGVSAFLGKANCYKTGLFNSVELMTVARHYIKAKQKGKKDYFKQAIEKLHSGEEMGYWEEMVLRSSGYAIFRLAEERHGSPVYKEYLNGNTGILLE